MGLFGLFKTKKQVPIPTNSCGEPLDRLMPDGELPWGWYSANGEFVQKIRTEANYFIEQWIRAEPGDVRANYAAIKSLLLYLNDAKQLCESKGECFAKWFSDIIASQEQIDKWTAEMKNLEAKMK